MIYIVHHFDGCDSINTRTTTYHKHLGAALTQYNMLVTTSEDFCKVELVTFDPASLTEQVQMEAVLNG
jgi:hypothetical protein